MTLSHDGRVAVVTGAGRGIGQAIARALSARGATLVLVDRADPSDTAALLTRDSLSIAADVSQESGWKQIAEETLSKFGHADIVVNNAGIFEPGPSMKSITSFGGASCR